MQNPDDKPSSGSAAIAPSAQPTPFSKAGDTASSGSPAASRTRAVDDAHEAVDGAAQAGDDFVKRLVEGAHAAIDKFADVAGPTVGRIAGTFSNPSGKASDLLGHAGGRKDAWVSDVRDIVREHPIAAIAVALAAGAVYAKLTAAPNRDPRDGLDD